MERPEPELARRQAESIRSVGASRRELVLLLAVLFGIVVLVSADLVSDYGEGASWAHLTMESAALVAAAVGILALLRGLLRLGAEARELGRRLEQTRVDAEHWRQEARQWVRGLGEAIDRELQRWGLSEAEREVALLLLKGLSHKEIASVRQVSERTVRQQAAATYKKAGLTGRADLAAYFLEDLLPPAA
jgi:DNA-binding CsgD family transcriptional regulator